MKLHVTGVLAYKTIVTLLTIVSKLFSVSCKYNSVDLNKETNFCKTKNHVLSDMTFFNRIKIMERSSSLQLYAHILYTWVNLIQNP